MKWTEMEDREKDRNRNENEWKPKRTVMPKCKEIEEGT